MYYDLSNPLQVRLVAYDRLAYLERRAMQAMDRDDMESLDYWASRYDRLADILDVDNDLAAEAADLAVTL